MLSSLLENLAALHLNLKWTKSPASDIGTKKTFHSHYCKSAFFKRQPRSTRPSCLHAAGSLNIPSVCERDWATRAMWRRHIGALRKRRWGFFFKFFFSSPGVARLVLLLRSVSRGARETVQPPPLRSARQPPLPTVQTPPAASSAKHRRLSARQVCFCFVFVFNLAAQRGFVVHKDGLPAPSCRGFHPCGTGRPAESLVGAPNVSEDDKLKCTFL